MAKMIRYRLRLTPVTPVVIGDGNEIDPIEYFVRGRRLKVVDIIKYLANESPQEQDRIVRAIQKAGKRKTFDQIVQSIKKAEHYIRYELPVDRSIHQKIHTFIKDPFGRTYVPGSSIKGAVRTALAYGIIREQGKVDRLCQKAREAMEESRRKRRDGKQKIGRHNHIVDDLVFYPSTRRDSRENLDKPHRDLLRLLSFSDSQPFKPEEMLKVFQVELVSRGNKGKSLFAVEAWHERAVDIIMSMADGDMARSILRIIRQGDINDEAKHLGWDFIRRALNQFARDALDYDLKNLPSSIDSGYKGEVKRILREIEGAGDEVAFVSLGQCQGWHRATDGIILRDCPSFNFGVFVRDNIPFPSRRGRSTNINVFPTSRKMAIDGNRYKPLGWVKMELLEELKEGETVFVVTAPPVRSGGGEPESAPKRGEVARAPQPTEPKFEKLQPEEEFPGHERPVGKKLSGVTHWEQLGELEQLVREKLRAIAELPQVKEIRADFIKKPPDPRKLENNIKVSSSQWHYFTVTISDGRRGIEAVIITYASSAAQRNYVANRVWDILTEARGEG